MRDLRLSKPQTQRRRYIKIQKHSPKGAKVIYWCGRCERYTYDLQAHEGDGKCTRESRV
jgi:hypothetical protein